jgi:putative restriction endonuclease
MKINILGDDYEVVDTKEKITIADSFVVRANKIGEGNGEAKLYVGNENKVNSDFFGQRGFFGNCFLLKSDLLKYLEEVKEEYDFPEQEYRNKSQMSQSWVERNEKIQNIPEKMVFLIKDQNQLEGQRVYIKSEDAAYELIREVSLPNITYISIVKIQNEGNETFYYFRLFVDYFGETTHPFLLKKEEEEIEKSDSDESNKKTLIRARVGQGEYRKKLLELCPSCPITLVTDDRVLIASHIKPWVSSSDFEKTDPYNGFMLTPTFDYLFDRGFLSFTDDKRTILSPFLSKVTYMRIGITDDKYLPNLLVEGREKYLEYHRNNILKK